MKTCNKIFKTVACILAAITASNLFATQEAKIIHTQDYQFAYVVNYQNQHSDYAIILMPGGNGLMGATINSDDTISLNLSNNFLIRSRELFADDNTISVCIDATSNTDKILSLVAKLKNTYDISYIYIIGTSRSTYNTMSLAKSLDGMIDGFIHTSSMNEISSFDTKELKSRNLLVHHVFDSCKASMFGSAESSSHNYGTKLIAIQGGVSIGNPCLAKAYHGYNGIESETIALIKTWIIGK